MTKRISHYLNTGEKLVSKTKTKSNIDIENTNPDMLIEDNFVCSEKHRDYFKEAIGKGFSFNVVFKKWLKSNTGQSYKDAIEAYYQILAEKKRKNSYL